MRRVQPLEKDPVSGEYKLPARVGILTVHSLGRVVPLPTYHNDRYIWPPGFKVSRYVYRMLDTLFFSFVPPILFWNTSTYPFLEHI